MRDPTLHVLVGLLVLTPEAGAYLDPSFGVGGVATSPVVPGLTYGSPVSIAVQTDGKVVIATGEGTGDFAVFRFESNGSLDATFGAGGKVIVDFGATGYLIRLEPL